MQHYMPFEKPWYVQRSIDNNPLRNGLNPDRSNGLESIVEVTSPNNDNGEHKSLLGYVGSTLANGLGYAGRIVGNIFSVVPSPVKKLALAGSLSGLLYVAVACSPASTPTPLPTPTPIAAPPTPPAHIEPLLTERLDLKGRKVTREEVRKLGELYVIAKAAQLTEDPAANKYYSDLNQYLYQEISHVLASDTYETLNAWLETCKGKTVAIYSLSGWNLGSWKNWEDFEEGELSKPLPEHIHQNWSSFISSQIEDCTGYVSFGLSGMARVYHNLSEGERQQEWNRIVEALQYGTRYPGTPQDKGIEALIHYSTPNAEESVREIQRMATKIVIERNKEINDNTIANMRGKSYVRIIDVWTDVPEVIQITSSLDQPIREIYNNPTISEDERKTELMRVTSAIKTGARFKGTLADKSIEALIEYATPDADENTRIIQRNAVKWMFETDDKKARQNMDTIQDTIRKMYGE